MGMPGNPRPHRVEAGARALASAIHPALSQGQRIDRAAAGSADAFETDVGLFEQTIEDTPGERTVRAASLQGQADRTIGSRRGAAHAPEQHLPQPTRRRPPATTRRASEPPIQ